MLSATYVNGTELKIIIGMFNDLQISDEVIRCVGTKKEVHYQQFMDAVSAIPEGSEEEARLTDSIIEFYNRCVDGDDEAEAARREKERKTRKPKEGFYAKAREIVYGGGKVEDVLTALKPLYEAKGKTDEKYVLRRCKRYYKQIRREIRNEV